LSRVTKINALESLTMTINSSSSLVREASTASPLNRRKLIVGALGLGVLPWVGAQIANASQAINVSGRQRMLSARTVKAYCQLGRGVDPAISQKLLQDSVAQFDQALSQLRVFAPNAQIKETFNRLSDKWRDYKDVVVGAAPAKERVKQVFDGADELVALANQGTLQLEQESGRAIAKLTNVCGRQRLLTQQIAAYGFARNWAMTPVQVQPLIAKRQQEYLQAAAVLESTKDNTPAIKRQLGEAANMWVFFESALTAAQGDRVKTLDDLSVASELILKSYDDLTKLYSALV
jgi:nitrate/nitrite-specific signal transduction histidine kinase